MNNNHFMEMAYQQGLKAFNKDEVPIGAVIIDENDTVLSKSYNQTIFMSDPTAHAEILSIKKAGKKVSNYRLLNATLYVTVEPCVMCAGAIIHARIKTVVYGAKDPKWGAFGSLFDFSKDNRLNHQVEVISGVMEKECRELIQHFFREKRKVK